MPLPLLAAGSLGTILTAVLRWFILAKLAGWIARVFVTLGVGWASYEYIVEPALDHAVVSWNALPASIAQWVGAFGVDRAASIIISAYGIVGVQRLVFSRRGGGGV